MNQRSFLTSSLLATLAAIVAVACSGGISIVANFLVHAKPSWIQKPELFWAMVATAALLAVLLGVRFLRNLWNSLRIGFVEVAPSIWAVGVFVAWILVDFSKLRLGLFALTCAALVTLLTHIFQRRKTGTSSLRKETEVDPDLPLDESGIDLLGHDDTVNTLVSLVILERPSIIALTGSYGDGKTSVLNLVAGKLRKVNAPERPIIVKFNPWLPTNSDALSFSLLSAISQEIQSTYFVPGFGRKALQYARAFTSLVPRIKILEGLFAEPSQQAVIRDLALQIRRLRHRVVVFLDDLDRMQAEELETIFKLLRGSDELSNVSFICSFEWDELCKILEGTRSEQDRDRFIHKFFPIPIPLPKIDSNDLKRVFRHQLRSLANKLNLLASEDEQKQFETNVEEIWDKSASRYFSNLRTIKRFVNKMAYSLPVIGKEVNLADFVRLELVRDVWPELYESIYSNSELFFSTDLAIETWGRGVSPLDDKEASKLRAKAYEPIIASIPSDKKYVLSLVESLFPHFADSRDSRGLGRQHPNATKAETGKRVFHPRFFKQYFLFRVPQELYSERAFDSFLSAIKKTNQADTKAKFNAQFRLIDGDFKRWHFMHRISQCFDSLANETASGLSLGMAENAHIWQSGAFELIIAVDCVISLVQRLRPHEAQKFLEEILRLATSDLFTLSVIYRLGKLEEEKGTLEIHILPLRQQLSDQLRRKYLGSSFESVFEKYPVEIDAVQVLFGWRRLPNAESDQQKYLIEELTRNSKSLDHFLSNMFRTDFMDDYSALKPLIDYAVLSLMIDRAEHKLNPDKVEKFRERYTADQQSKKAEPASK